MMTAGYIRLWRSTNGIGTEKLGATTVGQVIPLVMTIAPMVQTVNHFAGFVNTTEFTGDSDGE
jgi:hypothetical protein